MLTREVVRELESLVRAQSKKVSFQLLRAVGSAPEMADITQTAWVILAKWMKKYDPGRGASRRTYAALVLHHRLFKRMLKSISAVKVPYDRIGTLGLETLCPPVSPPEPCQIRRMAAWHRSYEIEDIALDTRRIMDEFGGDKHLGHTLMELLADGGYGKRQALSQHDAGRITRAARQIAT